MLFRGYIDESYDNHQKIFALSCLIAKGKAWSEMERMWKLHLAAKNRKLAKAGRPLISRYHATDCNSRHGEFEGWDEDERNEFVLGLFGIFKRTQVLTVGYDVDLDALCDVFPEHSGDRLELAYAVLTDHLVYTIGEDFHHEMPSVPVKITLFHDRTANAKYDPTILRAFKRLVTDPDFAYASSFTSIRSLMWKDCILLQPADLVAFEIFREAEHKTKGRKSRKSFDALINMESFGIHTRSFVDRDTMHKLRALGEKAVLDRRTGG